LELRALHLLGRLSTTGAMSPVQYYPISHLKKVRL
jgi:hypothetical protein